VNIYCLLHLDCWNQWITRSISIQHHPTSPETLHKVPPSNRQIPHRRSKLDLSTIWNPHQPFLLVYFCWGFIGLWCLFGFGLPEFNFIGGIKIVKSRSAKSSWGLDWAPYGAITAYCVALAAKFLWSHSQVTRHPRDVAPCREWATLLARSTDGSFTQWVQGNICWKFPSLGGFLQKLHKFTSKTLARLGFPQTCAVF